METKKGKRLPHVDEFVTETFTYKFKDTPERRAVIIKDDAGGLFTLKAIKIAKVPGENNHIVVQILKTK